MRRYDINVKLFTVENRQQGRGWAEIRQAIKEKFEIDPPTVRAMQRWEKDIDRDAFNRALAEKAKKEVEANKGRAIAMAVQDLLPRLWRARGAGEDIEYRGWGWFFGIQESILGTEKFWRFIDQYREERKGKAEYPPTPAPWGTESVGEVETEEGRQQ